MLILVVPVIGGWLGWLARMPEFSAWAAAAIQRHGGWVNYDWQRRGELVYDPLADPPGPRWLIDRVGVDFFYRPVYVGFPWGKSDDALMELVSRLSRIERLEVGSPNVTDAGLVQVEQLHGLRLLYLNGTQVSDAGLARLEGLADLRSLSLWKTRISDIGLVHLRGLSGLESLNLAGTRISGAGLAHLEGLTGLKWLSLADTSISDDDLCA